jgi:two-component system sensor histidine kinase PilS (NtrC family)
MDQQQHREFRRRLLKLILFRALTLLIGLNLADRLGLLPARLAGHPFLPVFSGLALALTGTFFLLWCTCRRVTLQLYLQIGADLLLTTLLVAYSRGPESPFVSFYLLIITYCSLTLGRRGGLASTALATILYSGVVTAGYFGLFPFYSPDADSLQATFRIAAHALGFWAVVCLASYLHQRLQLVEKELQEKIDSLTELRHLNDHIVRSIRSGLITTDLQGRVTLFNAAAGELVERDPSETIGTPIQDFLGEDFWNRILQTDFMTNARPLRHEQWMTLPDGTARYLGFSVSPLLDRDQRRLGYILSFQDLTEITRLEEQVRVKDRMAAVGRMAAGIAHEIRNPLTSMRGSVEILRSRVHLPETEERLLDILMRESDRLNQFIKSFLLFAHPKKHTLQPVDLVPVLKDSVTLLRNSPEMRARHSVALHCDVPSLEIRGSADQLAQVFWNLAQNAVRAMPHGGKLEIRVGRTRDGAGEVVFRDTGVGMTREEMDQLFQPFNSGFAGGLGLGLTIVFQIMEDHRGKIFFKSEKGKGTEVRLCFPLTDRDAAPVPLEPPGIAVRCG